MAVDDLWYLKTRGPDGERRPSKRHGRGKRWRVRYVDDAGQDKERLFERKADADRWDANVRADVSRGQYVDPALGKTTVKEYVKQFRETRLHRDSTAERVERVFRLHVEPLLGGRQMAQVKPSHIQSWVKDRATVLAPLTLRVVYFDLVAMFNAAAIDRVIGFSPCQGIKLPDLDRGERFIPSPDQVHALAAVLRDEGKLRTGRYRGAVYVAAGCGLRLSETVGLELEHIDFLHREIRVRQQLVIARGRAPFLGPTKTPQSVRAIEMGKVVSESLARHLELYPPVEQEIDDLTDPRKPVRRTAKLVFVNDAGTPVRRNHWSRWWVPAVAEAGLPEGFGYHGLRHYFATLLIHSGASVKTVQKALGHSKPSVTLDMYVHDWPDAIDRTRNLVDAALGPAPVLAVAR
jgi:integrase